MAGAVVASGVQRVRRAVPFSSVQLLRASHQLAAVLTAAEYNAQELRPVLFCGYVLLRELQAPLIAAVIHRGDGRV